MTIAERGVPRTTMEVGMDAIVELLQRVIRAGSLRATDFTFEWTDNDRLMTLVVRHREEAKLKLGFQKQDLESWPRSDTVPEVYHGRIEVASVWLVGLQQNLPH